MIGALAGRFQTGLAVFLFEPQHALYSAHLDQDMVAEQGVHQCMAGWSNLQGRFQTPLCVLHLPRLCFGRHMVGHGVAQPFPRQSHMAGNRFVFAVQRHHGAGRLQPQVATDQPERHRIVVGLVLDVRITVDFDLGPACQLRWNAGQSIEQTFLYFCKTLERGFAGGAVNAVASLVHHPRLQLAVGIVQVAEFA